MLIASVVLVASAGEKSIRKVLDCLGAQTVASKLEIVLSARPEAVGELKRIHAGSFNSIRVVEADFTTSARARVPAIRASRGEIVIFCEDHCFPTSPDWAEKLIACHKLGHAAVGPTMRNANPHTASSWANLLIEYGPWINVTTSAEVDFLPGHNSSYKRSELLSYGEELGDMLEVEWMLHRDMRKQGKTLWLESNAASAHLNFSLMQKSIRLHLLEGQTFAASRAAQWRWFRRAFYAIAFPAIFATRAMRVTKIALQSPVRRALVFPILGMSYLLLAANAIGEGLGYSFGASASREALGVLEYDRWENVIDNERLLAFESALGPVDN